MAPKVNVSTNSLIYVLQAIQCINTFVTIFETYKSILQIFYYIPYNFYFPYFSNTSLFFYYVPWLAKLKLFTFLFAYYVPYFWIKSEIVLPHLCFFYLISACKDCVSIDRCTDSDKGLHADVKFFQLTDIDIPSDVEDRYMETLVLQEKVLREELYQNASVIRKTTTAMVG